MKNFLYLSVFFTSVFFFSCKTKEKPKPVDFQRAENFTYTNVYKKVFNLHVTPDWFSDSTGFAYKAHTREGDKYFKILLNDPKKQPAFNEEKLAAALSKVSGKNVAVDSLALEHLNWANADSLSFSFKEKRYSGNLKDYNVKEINTLQTEEQKNQSPSPNGHDTVLLKNNNIYLKAAAGHAVALSSDGNKHYIYGSYYGWGDVMEGEDAVPAAHFTASFSPG